jgi:MYXO-CTERM domain-containing protein
MIPRMGLWGAPVLVVVGLWIVSACAGDTGVAWTVGQGALRARVTASDFTVAGARFETVAIGRDGALADGVQSGGASQRAAGGIAIECGESIEVIAPTGRGVEQSWEIARRPAGTGDLLVRVRVAGASYEGRSPRGLRLRTPQAMLGYSDVTWVDARGQRSFVDVRWEHGAIELRVPADVVDQTLFPAVLDPTVGPEFDLDAPAVAPSSGSNARVAFGGGNYLTVWIDGDNALRGARVRASDGTVLDPGGLAIAPSASAPAIASDGTDFLVAWIGPPQGSGNTSVQAARVRSSDAQVSPAVTLAPSSSSAAFEWPSVGFSAGEYLVAWMSESSGPMSTIDAVRVGADGRALDVTPNPLVGGEFPQVAGGSAGFLVTSINVSNLQATRVSTAGDVIDTGGLALSTTAYNTASIASDGANYLVAWQDNRNGSLDIYAARVRDSDGSVLDPSGIAVSTEPANQEVLGVAFDGTNFLVAWNTFSTTGTSPSQVEAARVRASDGMRLDGSAQSGSVAISDHASSIDGGGNTRVAFGGSEYFAIWEDTQVRGNRLRASDLTLLDGTPASHGTDVSTAAPPERLAGAAACGSYDVVAWTTLGPSSMPSARAARVDTTTGAVLDAPPIDLGSATALAVACTPDTAVVATAADTSSPVTLARIRLADGSREDTTGVAVTPTTALDFTLACGAECVAAWDNGSSVFAARVGVDAGQAIQIGAIAQVQGGPVTLPRIARGADAYAIVWLDGRNYPAPSGQDPRPQEHDVYGARIGASDGALLDAKGVLVASASGLSGPTDIAIAPAPSGSSGYLVLWTDGRLHGLPVSPELAVPGGDAGAATMIAGTASNGLLAPAVVPDGDHYLAAWISPHVYPDTSTDLVAARIAADGTQIDTTPFAIQNSIRAAQGRGALVSVGTGHPLAAYARVVDDVGYGAAHTRARFLCDETPCDVGVGAESNDDGGTGGSSDGGVVAEGGAGSDGGAAQPAIGMQTSHGGGCACTSASSGDSRPFPVAWLVALGAAAAAACRRRPSLVYDRIGPVDNGTQFDGVTARRGGRRRDLAVVD